MQLVSQLFHIVHGIGSTNLPVNLCMEYICISFRIKSVWGFRVTTPIFLGFDTPKSFAMQLDNKIELNPKKLLYNVCCYVNVWLNWICRTCFIWKTHNGTKCIACSQISKTPSFCGACATLEPIVELANYCTILTRFYCSFLLVIVLISRSRRYC